MKVPIENYLKLINITPNRVQNAIINGINDPRYRFITACVSRRVGKTYIANIILQVVALFPGTTVLIISPDYSLSSISWDLQRELLDTFEVETKRNNAKDRIIELTNGSIIKVASVAKADSAVGRSYDLIIFDEAALNDSGGQAFNIALRPTLDKDNSKCLFISTPRGDNWFREFFDRGFSEDFPDWLSIHADYLENDRASDKDIRAARRSMSHAEFEQEYMANFVTFEGQVWSLKNSAIQDLTARINDVCLAPYNYEIIAGLDMGFRDPTALTIILVTQDVDGLNHYEVLDEYFENGRNTQDYAANIYEKLTKYDIDYIWIDSAAAQTAYDLASLYDIATIKAKKSVTDGIGAVATVVDNDRLIVHEECVETIYALRNYKWKGKVEGGEWNLENEKPQHNRASHMADAIRYAIYSYETNIGGIG